MKLLNDMKKNRDSKIFANRINEARKLGVKISGSTKICGEVDWGSEPYLISIGDNCYFSKDIVFVNHDGGVQVLRQMYPELAGIDLIKPIKIGNNVFLGWNVMVLPGVTIGDNVIVGARSLVTKDLESNSIYAGIPAKRICSIDEYHKKHESDFVHTKKMTPEEKKSFLLKHFNKD